MHKKVQLDRVSPWSACNSAIIFQLLPTQPRELQLMWRSGSVSCIYTHTASSVLVWITSKVHSSCVKSAFLFGMEKAKWTRSSRNLGGSWKATDPTYYYMPQSNLPNILVRHTGFKPIFCLLFTVINIHTKQKPKAHLGLLPLCIQVFVVLGRRSPLGSGGWCWRGRFLENVVQS